MARTRSSKGGFGRGGRMNVGGQGQFATLEPTSVPRSVFDRSCGLKTTFSSGDLVPIFVDEALPGDTFTMTHNTFARMATPLHPFMDTLKLDIQFFAVPIRLVWDNFQKFMGERVDPADDIDYQVPNMTAPVGGYDELSLFDYMGLPPGVAGIVHSSLPLRCYNLIYNEWYRDENLIDSVTVNRDDSSDPDTDYAVLKRGKRKDYFTSALPWPQKGDEVSISLATSAPLVGDANVEPWGTGQPGFFGNATGSAGGLEIDGSDDIIGNGITGTGILNWEDPHLNADLTTASASGTTPYADLTAASAITINAMREAITLQQMLERDARGGTRYTEVLRSHFGVVSPDARLQRPEYLGGSTQNINVNPVAQTVGATQPLGVLAAYVTSAHSGRTWSKSFTEHSYVIGIASVRADLNYQQGINRMWLRETRYDFYWPTLAHLGEQEITNREIYAAGDANDTLTFGYQERYAEYKYKPSEISGRMRSSSAASLDTWHLAQDFDSLPSLNQAFIEESPPVDRVIAVESEPEFLFDAYFSLKCVRPMPIYATPGLRRF